MFISPFSRLRLNRPISPRVLIGTLIRDFDGGLAPLRVRFPLLALPLAGADRACASDAIDRQAQRRRSRKPQARRRPPATIGLRPRRRADAQPAAVEPIGNVATVTGIATVIRNKNSIR